MTTAPPGPRRAAAAARVLVLLVARRPWRAAAARRARRSRRCSRLPAAPQDVTARRTGGVADVQFRVPAANTDGTRPADVRRVEVYGFTGRGSDGCRGAEARNAGGGDPGARAAGRGRGREPAPQAGRRQGNAPARQPVSAPRIRSGLPPRWRTVSIKATSWRWRETIGPAQSVAVKTRRATTRRTPTVVEDPWQPLLRPPAAENASRLYFTVGVNRKGHRGPMSPPLAVPLREPPSAPAGLKTTYDEQGVTVTWTPSPDVPRPIQSPPRKARSRRRRCGLRSRAGGYNVYEAADAAGAPGGDPAERGGAGRTAEADQRHAAPDPGVHQPRRRVRPGAVLRGPRRRAG